jgi:WD40 repeat protein
VATLEGHKDSVMSMAFSPDFKFLATGGSDHSIFIWSMSDYSVVKKLTTDSGNVFDL